jgi:hypothetical protein
MLERCDSDGPTQCRWEDDPFGDVGGSISSLVFDLTTGIHLNSNLYLNI